MLILISLTHLFYNPLNLVLSLVLFLILVVMKMIFVTYSYFYSYLVFLLFMSGLLIVLMYICSVLSDEKFNLSLSFSIFLILVILVFQFKLKLIMKNSVFINFPNYEFFNLMKFYSFSFNTMALFFITFLFSCLIIVYEIVKKSKGSLRLMS